MSNIQQKPFPAAGMVIMPSLLKKQEFTIYNSSYRCGGSSALGHKFINPMEATVKKILNVVVIIILVVFLLKALGAFAYLSDVRI